MICRVSKCGTWRAKGLSAGEGNVVGDRRMPNWESVDHYEAQKNCTSTDHYKSQTPPMFYLRQGLFDAVKNLSAIVD